MISFTKSKIPWASVAAALCMAMLYTCLDVSLGAAATPPSEPAANSSNSKSSWVYLESGSTRRYTFTHYESLHPEATSNVVIELNSDVANAFQFIVKRADTLQSIGVSAQLSKLTKQNRDTFTQIWVGSPARETVELYVDVTNKSPFHSVYTLNIEGDDTSLLASIEALADIQTSANPQASAATPILLTTNAYEKSAGLPPTINVPQNQLSRTGLRKTKPPDEDIPGASPKSALELRNADWYLLKAGQTRWYAFDHDFDQHRESRLATTVQLETEVVDTLSFAVITSRMKILGIGIPQAKMTGYGGDDSRLIWTSDTLISGRYYVEISNKKQIPVRFKPSLIQGR